MGDVLSTSAKAPLVDGAALEFLAGRADEPERTRSTFWDTEVDGFSNAADGAMVGQAALGNVSRNTGPLYSLAHYFLQWPFRVMGREFDSFGQCERLGRLIARRQNRQYTRDMVRQALSLSLIRHHVRLDNAEQCNLVIGDGYGVMTSLLLLSTPHRRTILVNLTKPLVVDLTFARQAVPDLRFALVRDGAGMRETLADSGIQLIAVRADDAALIGEAPVGLAVNIVSMQEMEHSVINEYFRILRANRSDNVIFYCANRLWKRLNDGTEVRFQDYPWKADDQILHDSICPWSQWYYSKRPPFWHYRDGDQRVVWHRLARLKTVPRR